MATQVTTLKERSMLAMPECKIFDHGLTIGPNGAVRPCCAFRSDQSLYWEDDWQTEHHKLSKQSETEWLPGCIECKTGEDLGKSSLRTYYNEILNDTPGIQYWDLKVNNTCNLACRMCGPWSSSRWERFATEPGLHSNYKNILTDRWHKTSKEFVSRMRNTTVLKFTGGEPYLIPQIRQILKLLITEGSAKNMRLEITTNGTAVMEMWSKFFVKFKSVHIGVSIDGVGDRYEYIRPGAKWKQVSTNVERFNALKPDNCKISISCLPQLLNKDNLQEVIDWATSIGVECHMATPIIYPKFMQTTAWTDPDLKSEFIEQMTILDKLHKTNWRDFINE